MKDMREYEYKISVVMAVYNVEPFIREAIDSVVAQDIGFENIQLILVDDGSPDGSGAICDEYAKKYPENVTVIHKENGGVSTARNAGLEVVKGELVNFLDADDKLSENTASAVYNFYQFCGKQADVIAIPMCFFDGQTGKHILNTKFNKGTRVIDLDKEWQTALLSTSSSFISTAALEPYRFDSRLAYAEDAQLLQKILIQKCTLGVVSDATYWYRRRSEGAASAIQASQNKYGWYLPYMYYFQKETVDMCMKRKGYVPRFVQYVLMYDMQWRIKMQSLSDSILSPEEVQEYKDVVKEILQFIDDDVIIAQKNIFQEHKIFAFQLKYGELLKIDTNCNDIGVRLQNRHCFKASNFVLKLEFLHLEKDVCEVEGVFYNIPAMLHEFSIFAEVNGVRYLAADYRERSPIVTWDTVIQKRTAFRVEIPLQREKEQRIVFWCKSGETEFLLEHLQFGSFFPVSTVYANNYYIHGNWMVCAKKESLVISTRNNSAGYYMRLCRELWNKNRTGERKAVLTRFVLSFLKRIKRKKIWIISDQIEKAGDNGEAFFRYMRLSHPEVKCYFAISKNSSDFKRLKKVGTTINRGGYLHKLLILLADYNISSAGEVDIYNPFVRYIEPYRNLVVDVKFVFLQHGVTKDDLSDWLCRPNKNLTGFVTTAIPEYRSILEGKYEYTEKQVWLTGFPRFDRLIDERKKWITIAPTWRYYLVGEIDPKTGARPLVADIENSAYIRFYNALIGNERLLAKAKELGYQINFFPHPAFQHHLDLFTKESGVVLLGRETEYRDVFAKSDLLITDYSSTVFDFAYLRKPVFYTQFDAEEFFSGAHTYSKGYFDYERDGFGEVEYTLEGTVDRIIEYMENGCALKDQYRQRIDQFFAFNDKNNCQRVYEKIMELDANEKNV